MEARRAAYNQVTPFPGNNAAQAAMDRHLEQSHENFRSPVRGKATASPRHQLPSRPATRPENTEGRNDSGQRPGLGKDRAIGSSEGASGFGGARSDPSAYAEMVRQELRTAAEVCPRLATLVTPTLLADPLNAAPEVAAQVAAAAAEFLPEPDRNNDQTAIWGWRKHGPRVLVMLAICLEDPEVRSPCGYFGRLTGQDRGAADLRLNLARILKGKGQVQPPPPIAPAPVPPAEVEPPPLMFAPGTEEHPWPEIAGHLRRIVREGAWGSWFGQVGFHGVADGVLTLSTRTSIAGDRIKADFIPAILQAAEAAEVWVERVMITVRKR
jgi:hypothetical protein